MATAEVPLKIYQKYNAEKPLLGFNFARFADAGVTITGMPTITATKQGDVPGTNDADITITLANPPTAGLRAGAYFAGGIAGERYLITVTVNLRDGQAPRVIKIYLYIKKV